MCFFDSPIGRCEAVQEMVLLDETQEECACEHDCPKDRVCPLAGYFADSADRIAAVAVARAQGRSVMQ